MENFWKNREKSTMRFSTLRKAPAEKQKHKIKLEMSENSDKEPVEYPSVNEDIIEYICNVLRNNKKFYQHVLELMGKLKIEIPHQSNENIDLSEIPIPETIPLPEDTKESSDESEIETEYEVQKDPYLDRIAMKRKSSEVTQKTNTLKKFKTSYQQPKINEELPNPFERKIQIKCPASLNSDPGRNQQNIHVESKVLEMKDEIQILTDEDLKNGRLNDEQLKEHPVFQSYSLGVKSNKLYLKNLARTVTELELQSIFWRYVDTDRDEIEIKLMQAGKMRGQAFVVFKLFENPEKREVAEKLIEKAVMETNGYLLKNKPIYVVYGKVS